MTIRIPPLDQIIDALGTAAIVLLLIVVIVLCVAALAVGAFVLWMLAFGS